MQYLITDLCTLQDQLLCSNFFGTKRGLGSTFAQLPDRNSDNYFVSPACNTIGPNGCNYIENNNFTPSPQYDPSNFYHYTNPFNFDFQGTSLVPSWDVATGTPTVYDNVIFTDPVPPPPNAAGYFFGATGYQAPIGGYLSESIVQSIVPLVQGHSYTLSFYKMFKDYTNTAGVGTNYPIDNFNIVLMKCQDHSKTFVPITYQTPALPVVSKKIYCETFVKTPNWQQVFLKFTADNNYDMIWIYPESRPLS